MAKDSPSIWEWPIFPPGFHSNHLMELAQLQEAWRRSVIPAVEERSPPAGALLGEAHPVQLADGRLTLEFAPAASFHRQKAEEEKKAAESERDDLLMLLGDLEEKRTRDKVGRAQSIARVVG